MIPRSCPCGMFSLVMRGPSWTRRRTSGVGAGFRVGVPATGRKIDILIKFVMLEIYNYRWIFWGYDYLALSLLGLLGEFNLWTQQGGGEAKGERTGGALAGHRGVLKSHLKMGTSKRKTRENTRRNPSLGLQNVSHIHLWVLGSISGKQ